ncbi:MAG: tyrosine-type recombinase/integrase [Candidatus Hodarchaeota archaeon]
MRSNNRIKKKYYEKLEEDCQLGLARHSTVVQRKKAVNYFITFLNSKQIKLREVKDSQIQDFVQYLSRKETNRRKPLAANTIKQIYALVKTFYIRCYEKKTVDQHPDRVFTKSLLQRYKLGERKLPKYIDQEKMQQLLEECPPRWKALLHFMYDTGARISEVLNIQTHHLDFNRKVVQIYEPKTQNVRVTALSDETISLLKEYQVSYRPIPRPGYEAFLFINQQRRKMTIRAVQFLIERLSDRILGSKNRITPHYFRAACAVHLLEEGVDIRQVQEIIGWKSLTVVQNYTRVTPRRQTQLKEKFHPGFRKARLREQQHLKSELQPELGALLKQLQEERQQMKEERQKNQQEQQRYQQEIAELRQQVSQLVKLFSEKGK